MMLKCREVADCLFHVREAAIGNALSPTVDSCVGGTISADVDDLSCCLELMSATRRSSLQRYSGPGYADTGRRGPTVCTRHSVVLATSAGHEEVA